MDIISTVGKNKIDINQYSIDTLCQVSAYSHERLVEWNTQLLTAMDKDFDKMGISLNRHVAILGDDPTGEKSNQWDTLHKYLHLAALGRMHFTRDFGVEYYRQFYAELAGSFATSLGEGLVALYQQGLSKRSDIVVGEHIEHQAYGDRTLKNQRVECTFGVYSPETLHTMGVEVHVVLGDIDPNNDSEAGNIKCIKISEITPKKHPYLRGLQSVGTKKTGNLNLKYAHASGHVVVFDTPPVTEDKKALVSRMKKTIKAIK